jgi:hypothetical protein
MTPKGDSLANPEAKAMALVVPHAVDSIDRAISLYDFGIAIVVDLDRAKIEPDLIDIHLEPCEHTTVILND